MSTARDQKDADAITIGLVWHSVNSDNLGVGALTVSNIRIISEAAESIGKRPFFKIIGWLDQRTPYVKGENIQICPMSAKGLISPVGGVLADLKSCDVVFDIGGGDSFADLYGLKRFGYLSTTKMLTLLSGRPLILSPQTIGPFNRRISRVTAKAIMNRAAMTFARDDISYGILGDMGVRKNTDVTTDVAFHLPYDPPAPRTDPDVHVGINASALLLYRERDQSNVFGLSVRYQDMIDDLVAYFQQAGAKIHFVAHVIADHSEMEDDYRAAQALAAQYPGTILAPKFTSPSEAKSYIAGLDFFTGSRMHACIAAFSSGVPVVALAYSRKFGGLFNSLGYTHVVDCKTATNEDALARVKAGFENRHALREEVAEGNRQAQERLGRYRDAVRDRLARAVRT